MAIIVAFWVVNARQLAPLALGLQVYRDSRGPVELLVIYSMMQFAPRLLMALSFRMKFSSSETSVTARS